LLQPCDVALLPLLPPPLAVNVKQADKKRQACAATVTTTMRLFAVSYVASPLDVNDKQADDERRACAAATRRCRCRLQMRDHGFIPTMSPSPAPLSPPPHHPLIPSVAVRASLVPASLPPVVNGINMWPLGWRRALHDSGSSLMPIRRLLARLSPPHLRPPILLAAHHTLLPPASTPPVVIFV
jgi:hypothetical protein